VRLWLITHIYVQILFPLFPEIKMRRSVPVWKAEGSLTLNCVEKCIAVLWSGYILHSEGLYGIYLRVFFRFSRRQIPEERNPLVCIGLYVKRKNLSWTEKCSDPFLGGFSRRQIPEERNPLVCIDLYVKKKPILDGKMFRSLFVGVFAASNPRRAESSSLYWSLCLKKNLSWTEKCSDPFGECFEEAFDAFTAVA